MRVVTLFAVVSAACAQPGFDVATVKEVHEFQSGTASEKIIAHPGNLTMRSVRLRACIMWAYNVKDYQISGPGWLGAPGWGGGDIARFQIIAKAPQDTAIPQMKLMLQRLLAERSPARSMSLWSTALALKAGSISASKPRLVIHQTNNYPTWPIPSGPSLDWN